MNKMVYLGMPVSVRVEGIPPVRSAEIRHYRKPHPPTPSP
ncbi:hypothetical protein CCP3SC1_140015 [Gammaproteobacteria bacterium]